VSNKNSAPDEKFLPGRAGDKGDPTNKQATTFCPTAESLEKVRCGLGRCRGRPEHPFAARPCTAAVKRERTLRSPPPLFRFKKSPGGQFTALFDRFVAFFTIFSAMWRGTDYRYVSIQRIALPTAHPVTTGKYRSLFFSAAALLTLLTASTGPTYKPRAFLLSKTRLVL
jgi:hypothetical protein